MNVDDHRVDGAGGDGEFLLEEVARDGDAVAHQDFIGRAADAGDLDSVGAGVLGLLQDFRVMGSRDNHFRQGGFVAVNEDVDRLGAQHAKVRAALDRLRAAEEHVAHVGGVHAAAPSVDERRADGDPKEMDRIVVDPHVSGVESGHDGLVDAGGGHAELRPLLL